MAQPSERHTPSPSAELLRLAEEGAQKAKQAAQREHAETRHWADFELEAALRDHYGSPLKVGAVVMVIVGVVLFGATAYLGISLELERSTYQVCLVVAGVVLYFGMMGVFFLDRFTGGGAVNRERQWVKALPFALDEYFDVLSETPVPSTVIVAEMTFQGALPPADLLGALAGRAEASARVEDGSRVHIVSGSISGATGIRRGGRFIFRNHLIAKYVHTLVDEVLVPLHREYPLVSVRFSRV